MSNTEQPLENNVEKIYKLKDTMIEALQKDKQSNKDKRPALNRLKLVDSISSQLLNKNIQKDLLEYNILEVIKEWLEPMSDGTLPNIKIRKSILEVLMNLPVNKAQLFRSNGIGKIVNFYNKNKEENNEVRALARELVKKWTYVIVTKDDGDEWI